MLNENFLKQKLDRGMPVIGTWCVIPSIATADVIASSGLDFMILDTEHGPMNMETAQAMTISCESRGVSPVLRVGGIDSAEIQRALDIGIHCLQVPNVSNADDARAIVSMAKFPPQGSRGFSPFTRAGRYSRANAMELPAAANANTLIAVHAESPEVLENMDEIAGIDGIDIVFIGLFDISKALGIPGQVQDPTVLSYLSQVAEKVHAAGKVAGTITTSLDDIPAFMDIGIRYLVHLVDCDVLRSGYKDVRNRFDAAMSS